MSTGNKLSEAELIQHLKLAYALSKAAIVQLRFVRDYHNPEVKQICNTAKSKLSHYVTTIEKSLSVDEIERQEEISMEALEEIYKRLGL